MAGCRVIILNDTARLFSAEHLVYDARCTAHTSSHGQGATGTVASASTAFDTQIARSDLDFPI